MCSAHKVSLRLFVHAWAFIISTVYSGLVWKILNTTNVTGGCAKVWFFIYFNITRAKILFNEHRKPKCLNF
jgi:hypothetical protein